MLTRQWTVEVDLDSLPATDLITEGRVASGRGLYTPISRIDVDSVRTFFNAEQLSISEVPKTLVEAYNRSKEGLVFQLEDQAEHDGCHFSVYRNVTVTPKNTPWQTFYWSVGIAIPIANTQNQQFVGFVVIDDEVLAHTGGHAGQVFERFVDLSFPINVARRIAEPEIKSARSSPIAGTALVADVNFRDPRRLTHTESLENVWTGLGGQVRPDLLAGTALRSIFGPNKRKMRLDVSSSLRFGPKIETPQKMLDLMRWLIEIAETPPPTDDEWKILDSIKLLNSRKSKSTLDLLRKALAKKLIEDRDYTNFALTNTDTSLYLGATEYEVSQEGNEIYRGEERPEVADALDGVAAEQEAPESALSSVTVTAKNTEYGPSAETHGTLLEHLHGELQHHGRTYFLLAGRWYQVDANYVDLVTEDFMRLMEELDLGVSNLGLPNWKKSQSEGQFNDTAGPISRAINGDRVLTNNIELFDLLIATEDRTYVIHVKRGYDVKVRDVRSQIVNSANIIENDLRLGDPLNLKRHYARLRSRGRLSITEEEFTAMFRRRRTYVLAYGTEHKVGRDTLDHFDSIVARVETVTLNAQFRQVTSASQSTQLAITHINIVDDDPTAR